MARAAGQRLWSLGGHPAGCCPRLGLLFSPRPPGQGGEGPSFAVFCLVTLQKSGSGHFVSFVSVAFLIKGRKWACNDLLQVLMLIKVTFDPLSQALKSPLLIVVLPEGAASVSAFIESKLLATVFAVTTLWLFQ